MRIQRNRRIPRRHRRRAARLVHDDGATGTGILTLEARSRAVSKRRSSRTRAPLRGGPARPVRPDVPMPLAVRAAHLPGHPLPGGLHPGVVLEWDRVIEGYGHTEPLLRFPAAASLEYYEYERWSA